MPISDAHQITPLEDLFNAATTEAIDYTDAQLASRLDNLPQARRRQGTAQSLTHTSLEKIAFFSVLAGPQADISYVNGDWTINTSGTYQVAGQIGYQSNGAGYRRALIFVNGTLLAESSVGAITGLAMCVQVTHPPVQLNAGDVLSLQTVQTSGGGLDTVPGDTYFGASWLHS